VSWETERLAFRYVVKRKLSPEKAFKEAVRRTGKKGDLRAFLKFLRDYYYLSVAYPGREFEELFELSLKGSYPFVPPRWVEERARRKLSPRKPYWLRVNTLKVSLEEAKKELRELGIEFEEDEDFPFMLRLEAKPELKGLKPFQEGSTPGQERRFRGIRVGSQGGGADLRHRLRPRDEGLLNTAVEGEQGRNSSGGSIGQKGRGREEGTTVARGKERGAYRG
jgi:hypothetical protein